MALFGLLNGRPADYSGRESATDRAQRKNEQRNQRDRARTAAAHRRSAVRIDRHVAATEDTNRYADSQQRRPRGWW